MRRGKSGPMLCGDYRRGAQCTMGFESLAVTACSAWVDKGERKEGVEDGDDKRGLHGSERGKRRGTRLRVVSGPYGDASVGPA
jgi:hypothetical protein